MKQKILALVVAMLSAISCLSLAGCGEKTKSSVYFLNFKPESATVYEEIAEKYKQETGVEVKVVTAAANNYEQTLKSEIAKSDAPTIFQVNGPVGYDTWDDYCLDIKDSKLYSFLSDKDLAIKDDGGVYAVPYVVEGYGIIYNDEIMKRYFALPNKKTDITTAEEIDSFEKLKAVVEDMTANKEKLGIKGVFASTSLATGEDWRWQTHLLNIPLYHEFKEMGNDIDVALSMLDADEVTYKYSKNFENLFDLYINNSVTSKNLLGSKSVADSMAEFALGDAAMVQNGNWAWSQISGVKGNTVKASDIKMLPLYMGIEGEKGQGICIGTENYFAINKNADKEQQEASLKFLEWLFSSETGKKYVTESLGFITPFNTFSENELPDDPLAKEISRYMKDESVENIPWAFSAFPSDAFKKDVGSALLDYVQGEKKWEDVKKIIQDKWKSERS
ncbi:MAG: ABC transporter substrate-binding protein [Ruminococcaceae bacterium]|nr:ABC transporter substrate-binding protein [Oscillospiraceae bacterium]